MSRYPTSQSGELQAPNNNPTEVEREQVHYGRIPFALMEYVRERRLQHSDILVLLAMQEGGGHSRVCYMSQARIARVAAMSISGVKISLARLGAAGLIQIRPNAHKKTDEWLLVWMDTYLDSPAYSHPVATNAHARANCSHSVAPACSHSEASAYSHPVATTRSSPEGGRSRTTPPPGGEESSRSETTPPPSSSSSQSVDRSAPPPPSGESSREESRSETPPVPLDPPCAPIFPPGEDPQRYMMLLEQIYKEADQAYTAAEIQHIKAGCPPPNGRNSPPSFITRMKAAEALMDAELALNESSGGLYADELDRANAVRRWLDALDGGQRAPGATQNPKIEVETNPPGKSHLTHPGPKQPVPQTTTPKPRDSGLTREDLPPGSRVLHHDYGLGSVVEGDHPLAVTVQFDRENDSRTGKEPITHHMLPRILRLTSGETVRHWKPKSMEECEIERKRQLDALEARRQQ